MKPYFERDGITIYHGDCREVLPVLRGVGAVVTDPPYGVNTKSDGMGKLSPWADYMNSAMFYGWWIGECRRILPPDGCLWSMLNWRSVVTFQKAACDIGWPIESMLVWDKEWIGPGGMVGLRPSYELAALWAMPDFAIRDRGLSDVQRFAWSAVKPNGHPAEKPVPLMAFLVKTTPPDALILDPFMGSGTTLRAALDLGRKAIGIEIEERYCEIAARRLDQMAMNLEVA